MELRGGSGATNEQFTRPGLDVRVWSRARASVVEGGGDLQLVSSCASGRITRMLLADVCGSGPLFHELAVELRELMSRNVNTIQQARIVRQISGKLASAADRGGFATTLVSTYFSPTRTLSVCNAGHPPPLLFRARDAIWSIRKQTPAKVSASEAGFGVVDPTEYQQFKAKLEVGDIMLSYSNALTECRYANGQTIGLDGLLNLVRRLDLANPNRVPEKLFARMAAEHTENLAEDDATMLLCRATDTPASWRNTLLAPLRLLRSVSDRTTIS